MIKLLKIERHRAFNCRRFQKANYIKTRFVSGSQQILRVDDEIIKDINQEMKSVFRLFKKNQRLRYRNYFRLLKGLLTDNLLKLVIKECKNNKKQVIVDPKKLIFNLQGADIITPNYRELLNATNHINCKENNEEKDIFLIRKFN